MPEGGEFGMADEAEECDHSLSQACTPLGGDDFAWSCGECGEPLYIERT